MVDRALFSSNNTEWETPLGLFDELNEELDFNLDPAASHSNAKCDVYFTEDINGLTQDWKSYKAFKLPPFTFMRRVVKGRVFCNPPYGRDVVKWVEKAAQEIEKGNAEVIAMLLPARTDTRWFHQHIYGKAEIRFLKGRLRFVGSKNSAPFPSMVVIFRP